MHTQIRLEEPIKETRTLIQMAIDFLDLVQCYNESESEIEQEAIEKELKKLLVDTSVKFDNAVYVLRQLESQVEYFKKLTNSLTKKAKVAENAQRRLKNYLIEVGRVNSRMLKGEVFKGSLYSKKSVEEVDLDRLPKQYIIEKTEFRPDKKQILKELEAGIQVPGVKIQEKMHLRID